MSIYVHRPIERVFSKTCYFENYSECFVLNGEVYRVNGDVYRDFITVHCHRT